MKYLSFTDADHASAVADAVVAREREIAFYDINIVNFTAMLKALPSGDAPKDADDDLRDRYDYAAELRQRLVAERRQRNRSQIVLDALLAQLPRDDEAKTAAIAAAKARTAATG